MQRIHRLTWWPYVVAFLCIVAAIAVAYPVHVTASSNGLLFFIFFGAVTFASWYGGLGPGVAATLLSYLAANLLFLPPRDQFTLNGTVFAYFFVCLAIAAFSEAMRQALSQAKSSAHQTASILESMLDGFVALDDQWRFTYMNPVAHQLHQLHQPESEGPPENWNEFPPISGEVARAKLHDAANYRVAVEFENYHEPWQRWYEVKAAPNTSGGLAIYFRDVSKRKHAEDEQRKLAAIVDSSEDAIIGIDLHERIISWNAGATRLYGHEERDVLGKPISIIIPPELEGEEMRILARIMREEQFITFDTVRVTRSGRRIPVSISVSPIRDLQDRIIGASKIARDITDRKRAEALQRDADRRKDNFLAELGHELRNPLAGIVNGVQVLNHIDPLPAEVAEIRDLIARQAAQMKRLIDDLLDVSRIARGKATLRTETIDVVALAREIASDQRQSLRENEVALTLHAPDAPLWVEGDRVRLAQVLGNLLDNAAKFSDRGATVDLRVHESADGAGAVIEVRDYGAGLSDAMKETLFEPFSQAEETLARNPHGLGLGLALVKGLVELHRGHVEARSEGPGTGSTFLVTLPLSHAPQVAADATAQPPECVAPCRVLIIEDNPDVSRAIAELLRIHGHQVTVACDGHAGVAVAEKHPPDFVLCDIGLPGKLDGYAVARALRAAPATRTAFLVAITGFGQEEDRRRALEAGFDRHLTKPASDDHLLALLAEMSARQLELR